MFLQLIKKQWSERLDNQVVNDGGLTAPFRTYKVSHSSPSRSSQPPQQQQSDNTAVGLLEKTQHAADLNFKLNERTSHILRRYSLFPAGNGPFYFKKERKEKQDIFDMLHCTCKCEMAQSGLIFSIYVANSVQLPAGFGWIHKIVAREPFVYSLAVFILIFQWLLSGLYSQSPSSAIIQQIPASSSPSL